MPKRKTNASKPQDDSPRGRLNEDQERDKAVYLYLLKNLTDLGTAAENETEKPNESSIAKQWGLEDNRIFVRRVLRSVFSDRYPAEEEPTVPGLTLGKLVKILASLERYWSEKKGETPIDLVPRIITRSEKLRALRIFSRLSVEEREILELNSHGDNKADRSSREALLQQLWEKITDPVRGLGQEEVAQLYKTFLSQLSRPTSKEVKGQELSEPYIERLIHDTIADCLEAHFQGLNKEHQEYKINDFAKKIKREINRIEFQAGLKQVQSLLGKEPEIQNSVSYLTADFIKLLTESIVENDILTDRFPISLKNFVIEKADPLPLYVTRDNRENGAKIAFLNSQLLERGDDEKNLEGLERQFAYKTSVNFYIKLDKCYKPQLLDPKELTDLGNEKRLEFCEQIRGIGSPISHLTAAINRFLLSGIPAVTQEYLPIACELIKKSEFIGGDNHSLVWSHALVELCKKTEVGRAIFENTHYQKKINDRDSARGEYCGFDQVETMARAALIARLRAIEQTGISPNQYIEELCYRIEEYKILREARQSIKCYPFSLKAMEGQLEQKLLSRYRERDKNFSFKEKNPNRAWSWVAYEAHLSIAEAYLKEGLYKVAQKYLDIIDRHIEKFGKAIFNEFLLSKYSICQFRYNYLTDLDDPECQFPDRYKAVRAALEYLSEAETYLQQYLRICYTIDELPYSNCNPFFHFLSRIYAHRAKIYIFHPVYTELFSDRWDALLKPVKLLEKARIYAARNGDAARYSYWCAYQAWCYLMVAYLADREKPPRSGFSLKDCIDWAHKLVHHAMICYSSTGQQCYQEIKDRGGSTELYKSYGETEIQAMPLIQELHETQKQFYDDKNHILHIDLSILKQDIDDVKVYLFGTHSCILLFAMGMLELCEEQENEEELLKRIQKAIRIFTYCWAIAEDGGSEEKDNSKTVDRNFTEDDFTEDGDALVRGLYLHRLTQFADLGRIFQVTCQLVLLLCDRATSDWTSILALVDKLADNPEPLSGNVLGQKRYNGYLAEHYKQFKQYAHQLSKEKRRYASLMDARDRVVKEVFKIIRGET